MNPVQQVHFIAVGGAAMHNLAIVLHNKGYLVTGSDDEIYEPSRTRLANLGILPETYGWFPEKIHSGLDAIILGMHARVDNPELLKAQALGLKIYSYPEYIYSQSINKQRIVIAGSHGKTSTTSMILHVLKYHNRNFDYMVGAKIEGFETMAKLSDDAPVIIIEGDEYLSSPIDRRPKFYHYHHHIALITGIAWDHINVYPTFEGYVQQFENLASATPKSGYLTYDKTDELLNNIGQKVRSDIHTEAYEAHPHEITDGKTCLITKDGERIAVSVFGEHNMKNLAGAKNILNQIGIVDASFYEAISSFKGAANRLEIVDQSETSVIYRDFAHAPSKVAATQAAVKAQFPTRKLVACLELHTFSSLNKNFLGQYLNALNAPDIAVVYYSPKTIAHKKLSPISEEDVAQAFNNPNLNIFTDNERLKDFLFNQNWQNTNLLLMSSGTFDKLDLSELAEKILD
jgi:UDP-N-acetylmuramate: L-alanyl-gamma-D-glutamyl-meso-diaminopimelate ligase